METEDIIFFSIAGIVLAGFAWMLYWAIGASRSILHDPERYMESVRGKLPSIQPLLPIPLKRPYWLGRLPYLKNEKGHISLLLVTSSHIVVHEKARFFWEVVTPNGPLGDTVILKPFSVIPLSDIANYSYEESASEGRVLTLNYKDGDTKRFVQCANNTAFKQTLALIDELLQAK